MDARSYIHAGRTAARTMLGAPPEAIATLARASYLSDYAPASYPRTTLSRSSPPGVTENGVAPPPIHTIEIWRGLHASDGNSWPETTRYPAISAYAFCFRVTPGSTYHMRGPCATNWPNLPDQAALLCTFSTAIGQRLMMGMKQHRRRRRATGSGRMNDANPRGHAGPQGVSHETDGEGAEATSLVAHGRV